jgi:hypothetical protein
MAISAINEEIRHNERIRALITSCINKEQKRGKRLSQIAYPLKLNIEMLKRYMMYSYKAWLCIGEYHGYLKAYAIRRLLNHYGYDIEIGIKSLDNQ